MNKAIALVCLILMSTSVRMTETTPQQVVSTGETVLTNGGLDFFKGIAHGLSPAHYNEMLICLKDISDETFNRIANNISKIGKGSFDDQVSYFFFDFFYFLSADILQSKSTKFFD